MTATSTPQLHTGTWTIDPAHSEVAFSVRHLGLSRVRGRFNRFDGVAHVAGPLADSHVHATIDLASVDTNNDQRDGHLRSTDFFGAEESTPMTFASTRIAVADGAVTGTVTGDLSIGGVTRTITLDAELHGVAVDAYGTTRAGFSATTELSRKEFGIDFDVPLDAGGVLIGDKVTIELEIQLVPEAD